MYAVLLVGFLSTLATAATREAATSSTYYVAPDGRPDGRGTVDSPWDLASALGGEQRVPPGTTLYLKEGTYRRRPRELFDVRLQGEAASPIVVRPVPGTRVRIDGGIGVQHPSAHLVIRDLEIFVSEPNPPEPTPPGSHPEGFDRPHGGVNVYGGDDIRLVNLVVHHCRQGFSVWSGATNVEVYGCLIYDNGWWGVDRGHGHSIYTQNKEGVKRIENCIMVGGFGYSMHAYGSSRAYVDHYRVERNIVYDAGPFLIGGGRPSADITVRLNLLYRVGMRIGYTAPFNEDCVVEDNTIWRGNMEVVRYRTARLLRNRVVDGRVMTPETNVVQLEKGQSPPHEPEVFMFRNRYDPARVHVAVFNWPRAVAVSARVGDLLMEGQRFVLKSPRHFFGEPEHWGECRNGRILLPLYRREFAVWVLLAQ